MQPMYVFVAREFSAGQAFLAVPGMSLPITAKPMLYNQT
jgi:hypothetical protein